MCDTFIRKSDSELSSGCMHHPAGASPEHKQRNHYLTKWVSHGVLLSSGEQPPSIVHRYPCVVFSLTWTKNSPSYLPLTGAAGGRPEQNHPVLQQRAGAPGQQPVHPQTQSCPHEERTTPAQLRSHVGTETLKQNEVIESWEVEVTGIHCRAKHSGKLWQCCCLVMELLSRQRAEIWMDGLKWLFKNLKPSLHFCDVLFFFLLLLFKFQTTESCKQLGL